MHCICRVLQSVTRRPTKSSSASDEAPQSRKPKHCSFQTKSCGGRDRSSKVASTIRSLYLIPAQTFSEVRKLQRAAKEIWRPLRTFCTAFLLLRRHPPPISTLQSFISFPKGFCHFDFPIFAFSIHTWEKQRRLPIRDGADKGFGRNRISSYKKRPVLNRFFVFKAIKIQTFKNRGFFIKPGLLTI